MIRLVTYFTGNLFWIYTVHRFNSFLYQDAESQKRRTLAYLFFYLISCSVHLLFMNPVCNIATSLLGLTVVALCYQGDNGHRFLYIILIYSLSMLCDIAVTACFFHYHGPRHIKSAEIALGYLLFFFMEIMIERGNQVYRNMAVRTGHWIALVMIPTASMITICILILGRGKREFQQGVILLLLFINMLVFYLFDSIQKLYQQEANQRFMEQQLEMYAEKMDIMRQSQERINALYHDLKYHMHTIGALAVEAGNQDISAYLETMKMEVDSSMYHPYAANKVVDNILNSILKNVREQLHKLEVEVEFPDEFSGDLFDLSIVVGNLLDNAIRGALLSEEKELSFRMKYSKGLLRIQVVNSTNGDIIKEGERYLTTRKNARGHGIGLRNVRNIVTKYHGTMKTEHTERFFLVHAILYMMFD